MHRTTPQFWSHFDELRPEVQRRAEKKFEILKADSSHPSLHFKKVGGYWSVRIDLDHRALSFKDGDDYIWFWIGPHDEYEVVIGR